MPLFEKKAKCFGGKSVRISCLVSFFIGIIFFATQVSAESKRNYLKLKVMSVSGSLSLPIQIDRQGRTKLLGSISPSYSYFFMSQAEVLGFADLGIDFPFNDKGRVSPAVRWGFGIEGRYYFPIKNIFVYTGAGYRFSLADMLLFRHHVRLPLGILLPLSDSIALEFGLPSEVTFASTFYESATVASPHFYFRYFF